MTDREFRKERRRIRKAYHAWASRLGLNQWMMHLKFHRGPYEIDGVTNDEAAASVRVAWEYREATMEFNLAKTSALSKADLVDVIVHEAMHIHLREMRDHTEDLKHEERVASTLQWIIGWCAH